MTTKVTIDAHAGWPVLVIPINPDTQEALEHHSSVEVPAGEVRDFYIHSTMSLEIHERHRA